MSKESFYFPHDHNARNDRKLIKVKLKHRMAGIGIFWCIVEMLYEEGGKIRLDEIPTISEDLREKELTIQSIINDFDLFKNDGTFFWSESVKTRMDKRLEKSEKAKASAEMRWRNANAMRTHSEGNAIKEIKGKEIKESNTESCAAEVCEIVSFLNEKTGKAFSTTAKQTIAFIQARLKENRTVEDFKKVITSKAGKWLDDPKMCDFLRPETLFGSKFEAYLNESSSSQNSLKPVKVVDHDEYIFGPTRKTS